MKTLSIAAMQEASKSNGVRPKPVVKNKLKHGAYFSRLKKIAGLCSHHRKYEPSNTSPTNNILKGNNEQVPLTVLPLITSVPHGTSGKAISDYDFVHDFVISGQHSEQSIAVLLLMDIHNIFREKKVSKLRTKNLIAMLCTNKLWATFCSGRKINTRRMSTMLGEFGIHSKDIRFKSGVFKGFYRRTILEACRYFNVT